MTHTVHRVAYNLHNFTGQLFDPVEHRGERALYDFFELLELLTELSNIVRDLYAVVWGAVSKIIGQRRGGEASAKFRGSYSAAACVLHYIKEDRLKV